MSHCPATRVESVCSVEDFDEGAGPKVTVLDYGMGNLCSVRRAFEAVGGQVSVSSDPDSIEDADALVFPGQGAIVDCMRALRASGWDTVLREWLDRDRPFFGVCLGLQLLFEHSEEGDTDCLGLFPGRVRRFALPARYKVPHMGWNTATFAAAAPLCNRIRREGEAFYFVHSYYLDTPDEALIWCRTEYGHPFVSGIQRGNCFATQFHPEKSQSKGLQIYKNFLQWVQTVRIST